MVAGDRQAKDILCAEFSVREMWDLAKVDEYFGCLAMLLGSLLSGGHSPSHQQLIDMVSDVVSNAWELFDRYNGYANRGFGYDLLLARLQSTVGPQYSD